MRQKLHTARCATVAIAASLALGPTLAAAQSAATEGSDIQPVVVLPDTAAPAMVSPVAPMQPAAQPTSAITLPEPTVEASQPVPVEAAQSALVAQPIPAQPQTAPQSQIASATANPESEASMATTTATTAAAVNPSVDAPLATMEAEPVAPANVGDVEADAAAGDVISLIALALVGLIPVGLVVMALVWWRRRSRTVPNAVIERRVEETQSPASPELQGSIRGHQMAASNAQASMLLDRPIRVPDATRPAIPAQVEPRSAIRGANEHAVVLPSTVPEDFAERDALLQRLIKARPDRANPFHAPRARAKRARLIIQSIGRRFERAAPRFDLSQYSYLWPHLAKGRGATVAA